MEVNTLQEKRRYERYPIYCPIEYKSEDHYPKEPSVTLNISEAGALITVGRELPLLSNLIIKLMLKDEVLFVISQIRHIRQKQNEEAFEAGIEFWDKPRDFDKKFHGELKAIKEYQRKYRKNQGSDISLSEASLNWYKDAEY